MSVNLKAGDLVECNGKQFVVSGFRDDWLGDSYVYASPATKTGKADRRYETRRIPLVGCKLIKAAPAKHRWSGAGHVCKDCGAIKDTSSAPEDCPGSRLVVG